MPENIVDCIPVKTNDLAPVIPGHQETYTFENTLYGAHEYFRALRTSLFALAEKRAGWDSRRVQEILASGTVPLFLGLDALPNNTMKIYPRHLLRQALDLEGLEAGRVGPSFDMDQYLLIASQLLHFTKQRLVAGHMVEYIFHVVGFRSGKILCLHNTNPTLHLGTYPLLAELRKRFGEEFVDYPGFHDSFLYDAPRPFGPEDRQHKYYNMRAIKGLESDRSRANIEQLLRDQAFALIIIPELRWGGFDEHLLHIALTLYRKDQLVFLDDCDNGPGTSSDLIKRVAARGTFFMREMPDDCF